jgi:hypothetical protein
LGGLRNEIPLASFLVLSGAIEISLEVSARKKERNAA